jgi:hypothetical protein
VVLELDEEVALDEPCGGAGKAAGTEVRVHREAG